MNKQILQSIQDGINLLAASQNNNGGFAGFCGDDPDLQSGHTTDTIFFTALIAACLQSIKPAHEVGGKCADYLYQHKSEQWSWNYWEQGSSSRKYPDDWDDTACTVGAILGYSPGLVDATAQAYIATQLIATESQPGGPYRTWLASSESIDWRDIDPAVNANIGHMFTKLGVHSETLENYISQCIKNDELQSPYYVGVVPTLYFIARWYRGAELAKLGRLVLEHLKRTTNTIVEQAMLVTAAIWLGYRQMVTHKAIAGLLRTQQPNGGWPARALYFEPPVAGKWQYAGSVELTTAFVIEALHAFAADIPRASSTSERNDVANIAEIVASAGGWELPSRVINSLNEGSRYGWRAYELYDDIIDGDASLASLGDAHKAMRQSLLSFINALPEGELYTGFIMRTFADIDDANAWEVKWARDLAHPPDYRDYSQLAKRSWGHIIAPTGVLVAAGYELGSQEVQMLHLFFHHYIIARQLCDDAHDWRVDIEHGRVSAVVAMIVSSCSSSRLDDQQRHFWEHTIIEVNQLVRQHLARARNALQRCTYFRDTNQFYRWLGGVEAVCRRAEVGRRQAQQFIEFFTAHDLLK